MARRRMPSSVRDLADTAGTHFRTCRQLALKRSVSEILGRQYIGGWVHRFIRLNGAQTDHAINIDVPMHRRITSSLTNRHG